MARKAASVMDKKVGEAGPDTLLNGNLRVEVLLGSLTPMLMNPATQELLDSLEFGAPARGSVKKDTTSKEKAEKKVIRNDNGQIGIPVEYLFSCLREAGRFVKYDAKKSISTKESTLLPAFLTFQELFFPFDDQSDSWKVDRRKGVMDSGGKKVAVTIVRPRFDAWSSRVVIEININKETGINADKIRNLFDIAGSMIGLGDFRPAKNGVFGRFRVMAWNVLGAEKVAA